MSSRHRRIDPAHSALAWPASAASAWPIAALVKRMLQLFRERLDDRLRPYSITSAQFHILATLEQEPGISGARLARQCHVTPQTTQVLLRGVEDNAWILRKKHPENERILLATLSPAGKRILARSRAAVSEVYSQMMEGLPAKEVHILETLLSYCVANLESSRPSGKPKLPLSETGRSAIK
jgi:DNA-binding MarR family transcriptional regulator